MKSRIIVLTVLAALSLKCHGQLRNISVISYEIVSYNVFSDKLTFNATVYNDSTEFTIRSFTGLVYKNRSPLVTVTAANLLIPHGISTVGVVCLVSRCPSVTFFQLAQCFLLFDINEYSADISAAIQYPQSGLQYKEQKNVIFGPYIKTK